MTRLSKEKLELAKAIRSKCKTPAYVTTLLKELFGGALEQMLEAEIEEHLGFEKHSTKGDNTGHSLSALSEAEYSTV